MLHLLSENLDEALALVRLAGASVEIRDDSDKRSRHLALVRPLMRLAFANGHEALVRVHLGSAKSPSVRAAFTSVATGPFGGLDVLVARETPGKDQRLEVILGLEFTTAVQAGNQEHSKSIRYWMASQANVPVLAVLPFSAQHDGSGRRPSVSHMLSMLRLDRDAAERFDGFVLPSFHSSFGRVTEPADTVFCSDRELSRFLSTLLVQQVIDREALGLIRRRVVSALPHLASAKEHASALAAWELFAADDAERVHLLNDFCDLGGPFTWPRRSGMLDQVSLKLKGLLGEQGAKVLGSPQALKIRNPRDLIAGVRALAANLASEYPTGAEELLRLGNLLEARSRSPEGAVFVVPIRGWGPKLIGQDAGVLPTIKALLGASGTYVAVVAGDVPDSKVQEWASGESSDQVSESLVAFSDITVVFGSPAGRGADRLSVHVWNRSEPSHRRPMVDPSLPTASDETRVGAALLGASLGSGSLHVAFSDPPGGDWSVARIRTQEGIAPVPVGRISRRLDYVLQLDDDDGLWGGGLFAVEAKGNYTALQGVSGLRKRGRDFAAIIRADRLPNSTPVWIGAAFLSEPISQAELDKRRGELRIDFLLALEVGSDVALRWAAIPRLQSSGAWKKFESALSLGVRWFSTTDGVRRARPLQLDQWVLPFEMGPEARRLQVSGLLVPKEDTAMSEADVDAYLASLRERILDELRNGHTVII